MNLIHNIFWVSSLIICLSSNPITTKLRNEQFFEGDIAGVNYKLNLKGLAQLEYNEYGLWINETVPYIIGNGYSQTQVKTIRDSMDMIESLTCIKFVQRSTESTYLSIQNEYGSGCWSYIGRQKWKGEQILSLESPYCVYTGQVAHELIHALGFFHEQSRPDRDDYVTIKWNNIGKDYYDQFQKYQLSDGFDTLGYQYDYDSIMHYGPAEFSSNGAATIVPKKSNIHLLYAYEKNKISDIDAKEINKYYNC